MQSVSLQTSNIPRLGWVNSIHSMQSPTIRPKHAPTTREGIKIPATRSATHDNTHKESRCLPGTLMPKVMMVNAPLMSKASPTRPTTGPIWSGRSTQSGLTVSSLHSAKSCPRQFPVYSTSAFVSGMTHAGHQLRPAHSTVGVQKRHHSSQSSDECHFDDWMVLDPCSLSDMSSPEDIQS